MIHREEDVEQLSSFPQGVIVYSLKHMAQEQLRIYIFFSFNLRN